MDGRVVKVVKVLDQWFGADYRYCKVKGADGTLYILRLDENRSDWTLTMYASPEAQTSFLILAGRHWMPSEMTKHENIAKKAFREPLTHQTCENV